MDLAKIITELKIELQCLDAAIASMEELARIQSVADSTDRQASAPDVRSGDRQAGPNDPPPVKRGRGRPRKHPLPPATESHKSMPARSEHSNETSAATAA